MSPSAAIARLLLPISAVAAFSAPKTPFSSMLPLPLLRNPFQKTSDVTSSTAAADPAKARAERILEELDLRSSTEPSVYSAADGALFDVLVAAQPGIVRLGSGSLAQGYKVEVVDRDPTKYTATTVGKDKQLLESCTVDDVPQAAPIVLYERHGCPYCKMVREACSMLALDVCVRPCPRGGKVFRPDLPSGSTVPRLQDPNTTVEMSGDTKAIVEYLFRVYGGPDGRTPPWALGLDPMPLFVAWAATGLLLRSALDALNVFSEAKSENRVFRTANRPERPLQLYTYETSPYGALVQARLDALELEHVVTYTPRGSINRQRVYDLLSDLKTYNEDDRKTGYFQVPVLVDPNTGVRLVESAAICEYINKYYGVRTPVKYL